MRRRLMYKEVPPTPTVKNIKINEVSADAPYSVFGEGEVQTSIGYTLNVSEHGVVTVYPPVEVPMGATMSATMNGSKMTQYIESTVPNNLVEGRSYVMFLDFLAETITFT